MSEHSVYHDRLSLFDGCGSERREERTAGTHHPDEAVALLHECALGVPGRTDQGLDACPLRHPGRVQEAGDQEHGQPPDPADPHAWRREVAQHREGTEQEQ